MASLTLPGPSELKNLAAQNDQLRLPKVIKGLERIVSEHLKVSRFAFKFASFQGSTSKSSQPVCTKMLRIFFKYNRKLLGSLCRLALRSLTRYFEVVSGSALTPGVIAAIQTFGDRINLHPHLHFLVTEGGVDQAGLFHHISRIDDSRLTEFFAREVLALLVGKELLSPEWADRLLSWQHTGFNVHSRVRAKTKTEAERVGKYMLRPLLSLERLSLDEKEGQVCYQYGKQPGEVERMDYLEFIARVTSHIPDKGQVTVRYYGLYANAHRRKLKKASLGPLALRIAEEPLRRPPAKG